MTGKRTAIYNVFSKIPYTIMKRFTGCGMIFPYYHMISDNNVIHIKHLYGYKNTKQFKADIDFLIKEFVPVTLHDVLNFLRYRSALPDNAFHLSFDDGFREMHDIVAPILIDKGVPATFFLNSGFIDNRFLCYQHKASIIVEHLKENKSDALCREIKSLLLKNGIKSKNINSGVLSINYQQKTVVDEIAELCDLDLDGYLSKIKPYLTSDQIISLIKKGFTIGAHSTDHPLYSELSLKDQLSQTRESIDFIKKRFSLDYTAFAFPHSDYNVSRRFFDEIYKDEYVDISFGTAGITMDTFRNHLQRFSLEKPLIPVKNIISLELIKKNYRALRCRTTIKRK